jgi:hypothetical protein
LLRICLDGVAIEGQPRHPDASAGGNYTAEHVILFAAWIDKSKGTFSYYAENNPSVKTGKYTDGNEHASYLDGWPTSDYTPLRYKKITG